MGVHSPFPKKLKSEAKKAAKILHDFTFPTASTGPDKLIPAGLFLSCRGIAIITVFKAGFLVTARGGSGIVVSKLKGGGWSAPSAIGLAGFGGGFEIGAEVTDFVIFLNKQSAVDAFAKGGNVTLGGNVTVAVGPLGRNIEGDVSVRSPAAIYTYSQTKGLFAGISLEGAALIERKDANRKFYGCDIRAFQILSGDVEPPDECEPLYKALQQHVKSGMEALGQMAKKEARKKGKEAMGMAKLSVMNSIKKDKDISSKSEHRIDNNNNSEEKIRPDSKRKSADAIDSPKTKTSIFSRSSRSSNRSAIHSGPNLQPLNKPESKSADSSPTSSPLIGSRLSSSGKSNKSGFMIESRSYSRNMNRTSKAQQFLSVQTENKKTLSTSDLTKADSWDKPMIGIAQEPFIAILPCDLTFATNDRITIITRTDTQFDWWEGELYGRVGIFPANYVKVIV
ncbi:SH3 domain-containing YSC84-like protein 1 [Antedon mediterranea]|uniref:SH3 domain-containing YSC84-like protein 1 n=1 Tax=Antedon mediterranea TaxID=105859 RepID=UPI003AF75C8C